MSKDKTIRLIMGIILAIVGISGFSMSGMMIGHMGYGPFFPSIITIGLLILGLYLIYDGLKE